MAAILPLPKERAAIAPKGFTRRYGNTIEARIPIVARDGLDACVYAGTTPPPKKAPPKVITKARPQPGAEYETAKPPPPPPADTATTTPTPAAEPTGSNSAEPTNTANTPTEDVNAL